MYHPFKDGIERDVRCVTYREARPPASLRGLVHCYWELKTSAELPDDFRYHVVPDACVNVLFDQRNPLITAITALETKAKTLNLGRSFHFSGIQLFPGVWRGAPDEVHKDLVQHSYSGHLPLVRFNRRLKGLDFVGQQALFTEVVEWFMSQGLVAANAVTSKILSHLPNVNSVQQMARIAELSPRQLQRAIKDATGLSPHDFLKVLRIQQSFRTHYLDYYFDQAHFIHSFRKIINYTPVQYKKKFDV